MSFEYQIGAANGPAYYQCAYLPDGLSLDPKQGLISGIPTYSGTYTANIKAVNAFGAGVAAFQIVIDGGDVPVITGATYATGTAGKPFEYRIEATNDPTYYDCPYYWYYLPGGLSVD
jgi:hypothetical protein